MKHRVLLVHNRYTDRGGEETAVEIEAALLAARGHEVERYERDNRDEELASATAAVGAIWNRRARAELSELVRRFRPNVAHFHNTMPLISPAAYAPVRDGGAAVVQTLHNYRLVCPNGLLVREGKLCEKCVGRAFALPGVRHGCYRDSRAATAIVAITVATHRAIGTWRNEVDAYIALSAFSHSKASRAGLPIDRLHVAHPFLELDPGLGAHDGGYLFYAGRLSAEKGIATLLDGWRRARGSRLVIVGDGPLAADVRAAAASDPSIDWRGQVGRDEVLALMKGAQALLFPTLAPENAPTSIIEAFATGLPVIGSRIGSVTEMIGEHGWAVEPGDAAALAAAIDNVMREPAEAERRGAAARAVWERRYSPDAGYQRLIGVFDHAIAAYEASRPSKRA